MWITGLLLLLIVCRCQAYYSDNLYFPDEEVSHIDDHIHDDALDIFRSVQKKSFQNYKRFICRQWNQHCVPWTNKPGFKCCGGLSCKCNLWMQNCRCVSRLWGK